MNVPFRRAALSAALLSISAPLAVAQSSLQLEEVIVTAQKRAESLQDVPISVSAVSGSKMDNAGITNLEKLTAYVPNFSMNQTGISSTITIRGISSGINQSFEQSVGMYNDGIYFGKAQLSRLPLFDMERVEVLRGPQPILFGKNSIAGAVSMITAKPEDEFGGSVQALYEPDANEQDYRLVLTGPVTDTLSFRISGLYRDMDGFFDNKALSEDQAQEEEKVIRLGALWDATDNLRVQFKYENAQFDVEGRRSEMVQNYVREDLQPVPVYNPAAGIPAGFGVDYLTALSTQVATLNTLIAASNAGLFPPTDPRYRSGPPITGFVSEDGKLNYKRAVGPQESSENDVDNFMLNVDYQLGESTLTFVTGYVEYETDEFCDCDFTAAPIIDGTYLNEDYNQFSQEIRLTSPGGETFDYIAGLFYQTSEMDFDDNISVPRDSLLRLLSNAYQGISTRRTFEQDTDVWAAFAQVTWNITDEWRLILGGRYTDEEKDGYRRQAHFDQAGVDQGDSSLLLNALFNAFRIEPNEIKDSRGEDAFTPLVTVQWDATQDLMFYATYVEGFKSGGYDNRSNAHPDPAVVVPGTTPAAVGAWEFDKEEAESYEVGFKATLLDGAAELNGAFFYTEYTDLQTSVFDGVLGFNVENAGEAETKGVEIDGRWLITDWFTLSGSVAYLDFEFKDFDVAQCWFAQEIFQPETVTNPVLGQCDASGERKEYTPEWKGVLTGDFNFPLGDSLEFRATVDLQYTDDYIWTPQLDPRTEQDSFTKVNARIALASMDDTWEVALVGNNLTDEDVLVYGGNAVLAGALTRSATAPRGTGMAYYAFVERPRSYALQATYRF